MISFRKPHSFIFNWFNSFHLIFPLFFHENFIETHSNMVKKSSVNLQRKLLFYVFIGNKFISGGSIVITNAAIVSVTLFAIVAKKKSNFIKWKSASISSLTRSGCERLRHKMNAALSNGIMKNTSHANVCQSKTQCLWHCFSHLTIHFKMFSCSYIIGKMVI